MLHFKWGRRCGGVFKSNSPLKTDSHCPVSLYLSRAAYRRGDKGCAGTGSRVTKAPPLPAGDSPELVLQGHHWNQGSVRKSICKYPCTGQGKNLAAPASGSEQKVLAPNELCQFTISWTQAPEVLCQAASALPPVKGSLLRGSYKAWGRGWSPSSQPHFLYCNAGASARDCGISLVLWQQKKKNEFHCEMKANKEFQN